MVQSWHSTDAVLPAKLQKTKIEELYPPSFLLKHERPLRRLDVMFTAAPFRGSIEDKENLVLLYNVAFIFERK